MIIAGSTNVSGPIQIVAQDGAGVTAPLDLTGMTLEARFWNVGRVGAYRREGYDYGHLPAGFDPLLTVPQGTADDGVGYLVVDQPEEGVLYISLSTGQSQELLSRSLVGGYGPRRLTRQIWRVDVGLESMLLESVEWVRA